MKAPLGWLKEHVELREDAAAVARALVAAGVGIEGIEGAGDDAVLDLEITSNRADLLSIRGVARELALVLGRPLKDWAPAVAEKGSAQAVGLEIADPSFCSGYWARIATNVSAGPSPAWMQKRLQQAGIRTVNLPADITNYVMLETGQPLHAFDLSKLRGRRIVVRRAKAGEKLKAIDGKEYALAAGDGVIADAERPVAIAGVMGGLETEITGATKEVLIEAALFDLVSVRRTSKRLGLKSESSYRFERGTDPHLLRDASVRAAQLLVELAGGAAVPDAAFQGAALPAPATIQLRAARVRQVLGFDVPVARLQQILEGLGCRLQSTGPVLAVSAPTSRRDLKEEIDLVEEVARIEGYDKIPTDLGMTVRVAEPAPNAWVRDEIRRTLSGSGCYEVLTSAIEEAKDGAIVLRNPDGNSVGSMRSSLADGLLAVLRTNEGSNEPLHPIFEISKVYAGRKATRDADLAADRAPFDEWPVLGIAVPTGPADARDLVLRVAERLQVPASFDGPKVRSGDAELGAIARHGKSAVVELDYLELARRARPVRKSRPHSVLPAVERDLALVFEAGRTWGEIREVARKSGGPLLAAVEFLSLYEDAKLGAGRKSVALRLRFLAPDRTLTGAEVESAVQAVRGALKAALGAVER